MRSSDGDFSQHIPMTVDEIRLSLYLALLIELNALPQMKGAGRARDPEVRRRGVQILAGSVAEHLLRSNVVMLKGPPLPGHSTPAGARSE